MIAVLLTLLGIVFRKPVLLLLQTDASLLKDGLTYGYMVFGGLTATVFYNLCANSQGLMGLSFDCRRFLSAAGYADGVFPAAAQQIHAQRR